MKKGLSKSTRSPEKPVRRKRKYDEEFKQQTLAMVRNGQTAGSVAQALGISENLIHRWKRASRTELPATEQEIEQLRRQLKQVEMERDILKKALRCLGIEEEKCNANGPVFISTTGKPFQ